MSVRETAGTGNPGVSVLLPVRNAAGTVRAAVESLLRQSWGRFELLAVDDGSTDGSRGILNALAEADGRVRVLETRESGRGLVAALRLAAQEAKAPLLARMDADDISYPERFERQVEYLAEHPEVAACGCRVRIVSEDEFERKMSGGREEDGGRKEEAVAGEEATRGFGRYERWINSLCEPSEIARARFIESPLVHPTVMMRREAYEAAGGYREVAWAEDYDLWLRMLERGMALAKTPEVLFEWRDSPGRLTRADERYSEANFLRAKAHYVARMDRVRERGVMISGAGGSGKKIARFLSQEGVKVVAFVDVHPRRIGKLIGGAPVVGVEDVPAASAESPVQLGATGKFGRRDQVRAMLTPLGYVEGVDFFCVC